MEDKTISMQCPKGVRKLLDRKIYPEPPVFLAEVLKINDHYQVQRRFIALTPKSFYNLKHSFFGWYSLQRTFTIDCIQGLIRNPSSNEFVLKVDLSQPNDYRFKGDCWQKLTLVLLSFKPQLQIWTLNMSLDLCVRRKGQKPTSDFTTGSIPPIDQEMRCSNT